MTSRFAGRRWNWRGAAKVGESCLTVEPVEVLPGGDQQLTCVAGADAEERNGAWSGLGNQRLEVPIERSDLCIQDDNALAEGAQGKLGSLNRLVHPSLVRAQSSTHAGLAAERFAGEALAQFSWGCGNEVADLSQGRRAGLDGTSSDQAKLADRLDDAGGVLRDRSGFARQNLACCGLSINRIGLAASMTQMTMWLIDLDHAGTRRGEKPSQTCSIRSGRLHTDRLDPAELPQPLQ